MKTLLKIGLAVALTVAGLAPAEAQQGVNTRYGQLTNINSLLVAASGVSNVNSQVYLWKDRGMAFLPKFASANAATANVAFLFDVSADGTNWTTTHPYTYVVPLNGTTAVIGYAEILRDTIDNVRWIRLSQITNAHTGNIWVTNVTWSVFP